MDEVIRSWISNETQLQMFFIIPVQAYGISCSPVVAYLYNNKTEPPYGVRFEFKMFDSGGVSWELK